MKKFDVSLTSPEAGPTVAKRRVVRANIDLITGRAEVHVVSLDSGGNTVGGGRLEVTLGDSTLEALAGAIVDQGQSDQTIPAGDKHFA